MAILIQIALGALLYGFSMWGSIKILDRYNTRNTLSLAMFLGTILAVVMPVFGMLFVALPVVGLLFILVFVYDLGYGRGLLVIILEALLLYIANIVLTDLVGDAEGGNAAAWLAVILTVVAIALAISRGAHQKAAAWLEARGKQRAEAAERAMEKKRAAGPDINRATGKPRTGAKAETRTGAGTRTRARAGAGVGSAPRPDPVAPGDEPSILS